MVIVGVGGDCLDILDFFSLAYHFSYLSPSLLETAEYMKEPLNQTTQLTGNTLFSTFIRNLFRDITGRWMDGSLAVLRPFQQYFSHIRTMRC